MDVKQFLLNDKTLNRSELARRMWPNNKKPESYLSQKLIGLREFTKRDAERAVAIINQMGYELIAVNLDALYPDPRVGRPSTDDNLA